MPRWPPGLVTKRTCPSCGGRKDHYAAFCRACAPKRTPLLGRKGPNHPAWRGGRLIDQDSYIRLYMPDYEFARAGGYVLEHIYVMETHLGRRLKTHECVHHKDHDRQNNVLENLQVLAATAHSSLHRREDVPLRKRDSLGRFAPS